MTVDEIRRDLASAPTETLALFGAWVAAAWDAKQIGDTEAQSLYEAMDAERKRRVEAAANAPVRTLLKKLGGTPTKPRVRGAPLLRGKRSKQFGFGGSVPLDRNAKVRIMTKARALMRRTEARRHYGLVTSKMYSVLGALVYGFHNSATGKCFPSYEAIAERAGCARSTVHVAIGALEDAGLLSWSNRLIRVRAKVRDLLGRDGLGPVRVERTSNVYRLIDPQSSKSENPTRTTNPDSSPSLLDRVWGKVGLAGDEAGRDHARPDGSRKPIESR